MALETLLALFGSAFAGVASSIAAYFVYKGNKPKVAAEAHEKEAQAESLHITNLDRLWDQVQEITVAHIRALNDIARLQNQLNEQTEQLNEYKAQAERLDHELNTEREARQRLERELNTEREARLLLEQELLKRDERVRELEQRTRDEHVLDERTNIEHKESSLNESE